MKTLKLKLKESDRRAFIQVMRSVNFTEIARQNGFTPIQILLLYQPMYNFTKKLADGSLKITIDISTAAAIFTVTNAMSIELYVSILPHVQQIELYLTNTYKDNEHLIS